MGLAPSGSSRLSSRLSLCPRATSTGASLMWGADLGSVGALVLGAPGWARGGPESVTSGREMGNWGGGDGGLGRGAGYDASTAYKGGA